jgi:hypothetical protein
MTEIIYLERKTSERCTFTKVHLSLYIWQGEIEMNTNRLAIALTVVNLVLLIVLLVQGRSIANQTVPEVLRVRSFELVDEAGKVRAQLNVEPSGEVVSDCGVRTSPFG